MNTEDLDRLEIIELINNRSPIQVEYHTHDTKEIAWFNEREEMYCRIIAPIRFTITGEHEDELGRVHNYQHEGTEGQIHVNAWKGWGWATVSFTDPDECVTYHIHNPIQIGSIPAPGFSKGRE